MHCQTCNGISILRAHAMQFGEEAYTNTKQEYVGCREIRRDFVTFDVLTKKITMITAFGDMRSCSQVGPYQCFIRNRSLILRA
jgi:hypothetical protein